MGLGIDRRILKKKKKHTKLEVSLSDFKTYYQAIVIKAVCCSQRLVNRSMESRSQK